LVAQLLPGHIYIDRLSGFHVLIQEERHTGPHTGNPKEISTKTTKYGWYWNPLYGTHQRMTLHDHQFLELK
jgi:hypothetical protein